ncbi:hypothetical protein IU427_23815 [Nocardia beijingensis]|uniref:beta-sandwich lipoprotein n=1 Tax=Nocardia beijingensis TaxID=95162 RepID=UPI001892D71D|nr:hypothetical protein [Nocardia beijingensis]MBF6468188.1 hypothetical protein [Nocardia beijingensis]
MASRTTDLGSRVGSLLNWAFDNGELAVPGAGQHAYTSEWSDENNQLEVTCKTGDDDFLGLPDNVSYFVEQLEAADVSRYHYKVIFEPEVIIPDVDRP